jgi:hypothetical protein
MLRNLVLIGLILMIIAAAYFIKFNKAITGGYKEQVSSLVTTKASGCGGMYDLDSIKSYLNDTSILSLNVSKTYLTIENKQVNYLANFREKLFGKKADNMDKIKTMCCIDSLNSDIQLKGESYEGPNSISLRIEEKEGKRYVFVPNIILFTVLRGREGNR